MIEIAVQEVRDARLVSNVQWFNGRQTGLDWNFTFGDSRSVEGQDGLRCNSHLKPDVDP
jgi:hypothetical protein